LVIDTTRVESLSIIEEEVGEETRADLVERPVVRGVVGMMDTGWTPLVASAVCDAGLYEFKGVLEVLEDASSEADATGMVVVEDYRGVASSVEPQVARPRISLRS